MKTHKIFRLAAFALTLAFASIFAACDNGSSGGGGTGGIEGGGGTGGGGGSAGGTKAWPDNLNNTTWDWKSGGTSFNSSCYISFYNDPEDENLPKMYIRTVSENISAGGRNELRLAAKNGKIQLWMGTVCDSYAITDSGGVPELAFTGGGKVEGAIGSRFGGSKWTQTGFVMPD